MARNNLVRLPRRDTLSDWDESPWEKLYLLFQEIRLAATAMREYSREDSLEFNVVDQTRQVQPPATIEIDTDRRYGSDRDRVRRTHSAVSREDDVTVAENEWLRSYIDKLDRDRRDSDARVQAAVERIEQKLDSTRQEISQAVASINSRVDQVYTHLQQTQQGMRQDSRQTLFAIVAIAVTVFLGCVATVLAVIFAK